MANNSSIMIIVFCCAIYAIHIYMSTYTNTEVTWIKQIYTDRWIISTVGE